MHVVLPSQFSTIYTRRNQKHARETRRPTSMSGHQRSAACFSWRYPVGLSFASFIVRNVPLYQTLPACQVLDMLIAIAVGGGVLGLAKLFPVSFWGFVGFFVMVLTIGMVLWMNHKRTASVLQSSFRPTTTQSAFKNRSYIDVQVPFGLQGSAYRGVRSAHTVAQLGGRLSLCPQQPPRGSLLNNSTRASPVCSFTISYAQMKKEKKLRKGHQDGFVYAQSLTKFRGVNLMANRRMPPGTPDSLTPLPSRGISKLGSFDQPVPDFSNNTESLAQWVSTVKLGSVPQAPQQTTGLAPRNSYTQRRRMSSVGSVGMISEAGSR